ncbi:shikimate kinase [Candidatus Gromoviella agglomerans]|uniref:shikimate kinase n=1 Tax=Candidatus Gromoviella agglomerans TaxID=2806609 RepID=UPI001E644103|nr:shikimate kinase [Candidatus Gromoviella agglomerans]
MNEIIDGVCDFALSKSIVLVGLMGAGKSSIGRKLAQVLKLPFHDSDEIIEKSTDHSVQEIYELWGEREFRQIESNVIADRLEGQICVLSTGDGAFMFNMDVIHKYGLSIWINANVELLHKRVVHRENRQHLSAQITVQELTVLLDERRPVYSKADIVVDSFDEPSRVTVNRILTAMRDYFSNNIQR